MVKGKRPTRTQKSQSEIHRNFVHAFESLCLSSQAYDNGFKGEAARLAGIIYIFVYDYGKHTKSLLKLVDRKTISFKNITIPLNPNNLLGETPLVIVRASTKGIEYIPILDKGTPQHYQQPDQKFHVWWDTPVLRDDQRREFTRRRLITSMRHGEGGGHVDSHLDEDFSDLMRNNSVQWFFITGEKAFAPEYGPPYASVRQIAYEVELTLRAHCADILDLGGYTKYL